MAKDTRSQRGSDGRFSSADGPKKKPILIHLMPDTVERLDLECEERGLSRGKVIQAVLDEFLVSASPTDTSPVAAPEPEPTPAPTPEPTDTTRESFAEAMKRMEDEHSGRWEICKADAKAIGCKPNRVQRFKARHKLDQSRPLSVDAQQLLRDELERDQRSAKGEANALQQRLQRLKELATPERLAAMQQALNNGDDYISELTAREYFVDGLEYVGLKRQVKVTQKLIKTLQELVPVAASYSLETRFNRQQAVLWGAILRLPMFDGEPPTDSRRSFLSWCGFDLSHTHRGRKDGDRMSDMFRPDRLNIAEARNVLKLPQGVELTKKAISDAYKSLARKHHPDLGGTAEQMTRINEAKDRLMLGVS